MNLEDFFQLSNSLPEGYLLLKTDGTILVTNRKARRFLGNADVNHAGKNIIDYTDSTANELHKAISDWSRSRTPIPAAIKWKNNAKNDGMGWRCHGFLLKPAGGKEPAYIVLRCTFGKTLASNFISLNNELNKQRVLLRKLLKSRDELEREHEKAVVTLHSIGDGVITTDIAGNIEYLNPVAEKLTGWDSDDAAGKNLLDVFNIINEITREPTENPVARCVKDNRVVGLANHTVLISRNGQEYVIEDSAAPIRNHFNKIIGAVLVFHDTTDDRLARHQLEYLAQHDTLTGLKNRHFFEQQLKHAIDVASRGNRYYYLLYIDLDQFKVINDTVGHAAGDELLTEVSFCFSNRIRQGDILARLGGDEFGILIDCIDLGNFEKIISGYQSALEGFRFTWDNHTYDISCSIGSTIIDNNISSSAEAMRRADIACYIAKQSGRNQAHIYHEEDQSAVASMGEISIVSDIRAALAHDLFLLYFQPIKSLKNDEVIHEVLIRMQKGDDLLTPGAFLPIAERHNLMTEIDKWVLKHALQILLEQYNNGTPQRLSINLSGVTLGNEDTSELLKTFFKNHPELAPYLLLEITETSAVGQLDVASKLMYELRSLGIRFALDDFGTGFSSFTYLKHLPVDFVKIDGTFVRDIVDDPVDQAMVRSITHISNSLGKIIIAEFVENEDILEELKKIGVDMVQGYHIGRPSPDL